MRNKDIERKLREGYEHLVIEKDAHLSELPAAKAQGDEWYLVGTGAGINEKKPSGLLRPVLVFACAILLVFGVHMYRTEYGTFATVYLDVNPSVSLTVNKKERVTGVKTENPDGEIILSDMDLKHTDIHTAVNALLGSMLRHGYLDEAHSILLLTVDCSSKEKADDLLYRLDRDVNGYLSASLGTGRVIDREIRVDDELQKQSSAYAVSPSKAGFINELIEGTDLRFEDLADLSISDIISVLRENGVREEDILDEIEDLNEDDEADDVDDDFDDHEDAVPFDSDDIDDDDFDDHEDAVPYDDDDDFDDPEEDGMYEQEEAGDTDKDPDDDLPYEYEDTDDTDEDDAEVIETDDLDDEENEDVIETDDHDDEEDGPEENENDDEEDDDD